MKKRKRKTLHDEAGAVLKKLPDGGAKVIRHPVTFRYDALNHDFIKMLADIAFYASNKYGSAEQYANGRLEGEKSPINHIYEHLRAYQAGEEHDHFGDPRYHLAAVAYGAMMEFLYHTRFGHKVSVLFGASADTGVPLSAIEIARIARAPGLVRDGKLVAPLREGRKLTRGEIHAIQERSRADRRRRLR